MNEISSLKQSYALTDEGDLHDYLGTRFDRHNDGSVTLTQPRMIERALSIVGLHGTDSHIKRHDTPAIDILVPSTKTKPRLQKWNYRSAVGYLSYIQAMVRPDITFAVQQCARFCHSPSKTTKKLSNAFVVIYLVHATKASSYALTRQKGSNATSTLAGQVPGLSAPLMIHCPLTLVQGLSSFMPAAQSCGSPRFSLSQLSALLRPNI